MQKINRNVSLKFVSKSQINNIPALVQIIACRRPGDKPLSEPMVAIILTHICVTRPQCCDNTKYGSKINAYQDGNALSHQIIYISHCGDKTVLGVSYIQNGISYTGRTIFVFWNVAQNNTHKQSGRYWTENIGVTEKMMRTLRVILNHATDHHFLIFFSLLFHL